MLTSRHLEMHQKWKYNEMFLTPELASTSLSPLHLCDQPVEELVEVVGEGRSICIVYCVFVLCICIVYLY